MYIMCEYVYGHTKSKLTKKNIPVNSQVEVAYYGQRNDNVENRIHQKSIDLQIPKVFPVDKSVKVVNGIFFLFPHRIGSDFKTFSSQGS